MVLIRCAGCSKQTVIAITENQLLELVGAEDTLHWVCPECRYENEILVAIPEG